MKFIPLIICAIVALALPACTTSKKQGCGDMSCCAKGKSSAKAKH